MSKPRIAAVVINSVSHDARVLKEADSLAAAGYDVTVLGIQDNRCDDPVTHRESGVVIRRCAWKGPAHRAVANACLVTGSVLVGCALIGYLLLFEQLYALVNPRGIAFAVGIALILPILLPFYLKFQRYRTIARRLDNTPLSARAWTRPLTFRSGLDATTTKMKTVLFRKVREAQLVEMLAEIDPAVVHCHDLSALPIGCIYAGHGRCKVVYDSHEIYEELSLTGRLHRITSRHRQRRYSGRVDGFITINDSIADYLGRTYPRLPDAVVVKNATLPLAEALSYDGRLHEAAGLARERRILLYQGGFARFRGLDVLVRAGARLPEAWCLVMMGWGTYESHLRTVAERVDPGGDRVRFIPPAPHQELVAWTAGASLGAIPYENVCLNHWFCSPNKLWEYPNAGVPILASPFPELRGPIEAHGIGRLLPDPITPESIARVVSAVTEEDLAEMRRNCRRFIEEDNWSVYETRLVDLYRGLLGGRPETPPRAAAMIEVAKIPSPAVSGAGAGAGPNEH